MNIALLLLALIISTTTQVALSATTTLLTENKNSRSLLYHCSNGEITEKLSCVKRGSLVKKWICGENEYRYIDKFLDIAIDASCTNLIRTREQEQKK